MTTLHLILLLILIGVVVWVIETQCTFIDATWIKFIRTVAIIGSVILVVVWLLAIFGETPRSVLGGHGSLAPTAITA